MSIEDDSFLEDLEADREHLVTKQNISKEWGLTTQWSQDSRSKNNLPTTYMPDNGSTTAVLSFATP